MLKVSSCSSKDLPNTMRLFRYTIMFMEFIFPSTLSSSAAKRDTTLRFGVFVPPKVGLTLFFLS